MYILDKNEIIIPLDRLQEGHSKCAKHIELLIDSCDVLLSSRKYPTTIALSILALEESAKLELIQNHLIHNVGISKKEWDSVTSYGSHSKKLKNPVREEVEAFKRVGKEIVDHVGEWNEYLFGFPTPSYEDYQSITEKHYEYFGKLNFVKQDCLYMKWDNSKWKTFSIFSENQQKALAFYRVVHTKLVYYESMINNRFFQITKDIDVTLKTVPQTHISKHKKQFDELNIFRDKLIKTHELEQTKNYKNASTIVGSMMREY